MRPRLLASGLLFTLLLLTGCARSAVSPANDKAASGENATGVADRIFVLERGGIAIVDTATGTRERVLRVGVPSPDWSILYTASPAYRASGADTTTIRAVSVATGKTLREKVVDRAYKLPVVDFGGLPAGLSPDGRWLTLFEAGDGKSRVVVMDTAFAQAPRPVELDGDFGFDAIDNNASVLFLIQYVVPSDRTRYQVRAFDLAQGLLRPGAVVDKTAGQPIMQGLRQTSVASPDGQYVFSLYFNWTHGPFIHALDVRSGVAQCIFLPRGKELMWSLAMTPDASRLFAANGALGAAVEINTRTLKVIRSTTQLGKSAKASPLTQLANWIAPPAHAKELLAHAALTADGQTLFMSVERGILAVNTGDFSLRGRYLTDTAIDSLAVSPDGARIYVVSSDVAKVLRVDLASGGAVTTVRGPVGPLAVLRVDSKASR